MELIERRMCAISWVIESKGFERLALENGEKGHIKEFCEDSEPKLFRGSTVFDGKRSPPYRSFSMTSAQ